MTDRPVTPADVLAAAINASDTGNGKRFVSEWRHTVRYVAPWRSWVAWDGRRWLRDDIGRAVELAKQTVQGIYREASYAETEDERKALGKHALKSEAAARLLAMLQLAQSEAGVPIDADGFDTDPWLLTCANGTVDLRTGQLRPHNPADLVTKLAPVVFDPAAACPRWTAFLLEIMAGQADVVRFIQKAVGYAMTGVTRERAFFLLHGEGSNGKSVMLSVLNDMLGDYAAMASMDTFMQKERETISNDVARLHGVRFVAASESEQQKRLAEALIKSLTGGDPVTARFLHKEFFTFTPRFKIFLATNHLPVIRGAEHAIWSRIRLIPFTVRFDEAQQDKELKTKLAEESSGILAWAVEGCRLWQSEGLGTPAAITEAVGTYRSQMDIVGTFLDERCERGTALAVMNPTVYGAYVKWAKDAGERVMPQRTFSQALAERGFKQDRTKTDRYWEGLALRPEPNGTGPGREPGDEETPF